MKILTMQILALALVLNACNFNKNREETIFIYDSEKKAIFLNMLNEKKVDYRIQNDGQIFYPVEQKEIVKEAFEKVMGNKIPDL